MKMSIMRKSIMKMKTSIMTMKTTMETSMVMVMAILFMPIMFKKMLNLMDMSLNLEEPLMLLLVK